MSEGRGEEGNEIREQTLVIHYWNLYGSFENTVQVVVKEPLAFCLNGKQNDRCA